MNGDACLKKWRGIWTVKIGVLILPILLSACGLGIDKGPAFNREAYGIKEKELYFISYELEGVWPETVAKTIINKSIPEKSGPFLVNKSVLNEGSEPLIIAFNNIDQYIDQSQGLPTVYQYKVIYKVNGILASASVFFNQSSSKVKSFLGAERGTLMAHNKAPSLSFYNLQTEDYKITGAGDMEMMMLFAYEDYIVVIPDQLGFGISEQVFHPYCIASTSVDSMIGALNAAKQVVEIESKTSTFNQDLYLTGYSQGGYSAMASCKAIIEDPSIVNLTLKACAPNAGPFDLSGVMTELMLSEFVISPTFLPYLIFAYQAHYGADFYQENDVWTSIEVLDLEGLDIGAVRSIEDEIQSKLEEFAAGPANKNINIGSQIKEAFDFSEESGQNILVAMSPEFPTLNFTPKTILKEELRDQLNLDLKSQTQSNRLTQKLWENDLYRVHEWRGDYTAVPFQLCHLEGDRIVPKQNSKNTVKNAAEMNLVDPSGGIELFTEEGIKSLLFHHILGIIPCYKETKVFFDKIKNS